MDNNHSDKIIWEEEESNFNLREVIDFLWNLKYWIIASVSISLVIALLYTKMATTSFEKNMVVMMVNEEGSGSNELTLLYDLTGKNQTSKIDNELFILRSPSLMEQVVTELGLNTRYFEYKVPIFNDLLSILRPLFSIKKVEYYRNNPFVLSFKMDSTYITQAIYVEFEVKEGNKYEITELISNGSRKKLSKCEYNFGEDVVVNGFSINIEVTDSSHLKINREYACSWENSYNRALGLSSALKVTVLQEKNKQTDLISITKEDSNPLRAEEVLNTLVTKYNQQAREFKSEVGINTIKFIDNRLAVIAKELGNVESDMKKYQSSNVLVDLESQSHFALTSDIQYDAELNDVRLQLKVLEMIKSYIEKTPKFDYKVIPANVGVADNGLNKIINQYNALVTERNRLLSNSSSNNPRVLNANQALSDGKKSIELTVANLVQSYAIKEKELEKLSKSSKRKVASIPIQQFDMAQIVRKQQIIEPLYLLLQQKREETQIAIYSKTDNVRVIESAYGSNAPIKPNKSMVLLLACMIGFILPPTIILLRVLFKIKVETSKDIEKTVNSAIVSVIPKDKKNRNILSSDCRDSFTESFRTLSSNLQFLPGKVFQVTSSMRGEGKSFISVNMATSLAYTNKKVLLVGLDLRRPSIPKYFPDMKLSENKGAISYLCSQTEDLDSLVVKSSVSSNLDILISGKIVPNPTVLLSSDRFEQMINHFKEKYDYVICDSPPYFAVSDSSIINKHMDYTLYIIRADYSDMRSLPDIEKLNKERKLTNLNLVFNSVNIESAKYRYGYGYGYSYGYHYGYGYEYTDDDDVNKKRRKKKNFWGKIVNRRKK